MPTSSSVGAPLLEAVGVRKSFGPVAALREVSLRVAPGSVHALMGGNGSGKSTLAKVLLGVVRPDAGAIQMGRHVAAVGRSGPSASRQAGIHGTFQETALADDLSVAENVLVDAMPKRFGVIAAPRVRRAELVETLDRVGLPAALADRKVRELALEQRCLVELARVLRREPRLLILDELTASLRRPQVLRVGEILAELTAAGTSVLFVSHRLEEITEMCDSATVLRNGRDVLHTDDVSADRMDELLACMTGDELVRPGASARHAPVARPEVDEPVLCTRGLSVAGFDATVSLTAHRGEIVGIAGLGGNGQSELLMSVFGAFGPQDGRIELDGRDVRVHGVRDAVALGIGYLSGERERDMAFGQRSVGENLGVVATGLGRVVDPAPLMERLKLVAHRRAPMRALSGGNQQKVVLGRWVGLRPRVLLADDPTRGVDVSTRSEIHAVLREMVADEGSCVVVSSSDDRELAELCDRVYVLHQAAVIAELTGAELTEHAIGRAALTGHRARSEGPTPADVPVREVAR